MAIVQIQRVYRYRDGAEAVTFAETFDLATHREYEDALQRVERDLVDGEFSRTVGEDSPLMVHAYDDGADEVPLQ